MNYLGIVFPTHDLDNWANVCVDNEQKLHIAAILKMLSLAPVFDEQLVPVTNEAQF